MSVLASTRQDGWNVERFDEDRFTETMKELVKQQDALREDVLRQVVGQRRRSHEATSGGVLPVFYVGEYVFVARPRKVNKLVVTRPVHDARSCRVSTCILWTN